ncbi:MAG TPA: hypothetical protein VGR61_10425 [Candidatus Dormibacteraeota bacterium]|nr:hypothetical protein [Candidatus Dormibacteraeota bacterium]
MPSNQAPPPEVEELARQRLAARAAKDYPLADSIRLRIAGSGWEVADIPGGFVLSPRAAAAESYRAYNAVPAAYGDPDACVHSLCIAFHGWPQDVERLLAGVLGSAGARQGELEVILAIVEGEPGAQLLQATHPALSRGPVAVAVDEGLGQAQALNVAARRALGRIVHFVEPSLEFGWDILEAASQVLTDSRVGACGPLGLVTEDWREFRPAPTGEVMALEYLLSVRRADLVVIGEMDPGFRFYRNLDLDFSRQVAAAGFQLRSYDAPVTRHLHRLWENTVPEERDRLSRRNFNRLLDRWVRRDAPAS